MTTPQTSERHGFTFKGDGAEYFGIWIVNLALSILTLGVYSAWAKVRHQRYFYGNTQLDGDGFEYLATPVQILIGRLVAMAAIMLWVLCTSFFPPLAMLAIMVLSVLTPWLAVRNLRFDARVTRFRNVRFDFVGSVEGGYVNFLGKPMLAYVLVFSAGCIGAMLGAIMGMVGGKEGAIIGAVGLGTLSFLAGSVLSYGWLIYSIADYVGNHYRYGDKQFKAEIRLGEYFKTAAFATLLLVGLMIVAGLLMGLAGVAAGSLFEELGQGGEQAGQTAMIAVGVFYLIFFAVAMLVSAFVKVRLRNHLFNQTSIDGQLQLRSTLSVGSYLWVVVSNFLLIVVTLGLGSAWAQVRYAKLIADGTAVEGDLSLVAVKDHQQQTDVAIADEVASAFDVNIGII